MTHSNRTFTSLFRVVLSILTACAATSALATGAGAGGRDVLHVPMSWCIVNGSPAQTTPNVLGDTDTDAVIWRRHERPTDNIYLPHALLIAERKLTSACGR